MQNRSYPICDRPDTDDLPHQQWKCDCCNAINSMFDAECQFCDGDEQPEQR
jgi:hypothetical protein